MALGLVQQTNGSWGSSSSFSWGSAPSSGNLLVVATAHRSDGTTNDTASISTTDGGYTKRAEFTANPTDGTYRRGFALWTKTATASETASIATSWNGSASNIAWGIEVSGLTETLNEVLEFDNGATANATSISDTTANSYSGTFQAIMVYAIKMNSAQPDASTLVESWTDLSNAGSFASASTNQMHMLGGYGDPSVSGTYTTAGSFSATGGTNNNGLIGASLIFGTVSGGGGLVIPVAMHHYRHNIG